MPSLKCLCEERCSSSARLVSVAVVATLSGCDVAGHGFLNAHGPVSSGERHLFCIVASVMMLVIVPVLVLTPLFAWHYRLRNRDHAYRPNWKFSWWLELLIWLPPSLIVASLAVLVWRSSHQFDPYTPLPLGAGRIEVQAVAFDWKWLFIYPQSGVAAVDELEIPVGHPVHITLTSATVMQSIYIPVLAGQIYAMGGMVTQLNLAADRTGVFMGENTQFNGAGYPRDQFSVVSVSDTDFERWVARLRTAGSALDGAALGRLSAKSVESKPLYFATAPPGLFQQILARVRSSAPVADAGAR